MDTVVEQPVILPWRSLIALCGPAGAGKSTFSGTVAQYNRLATTSIVSSDSCRLMLCDELGSLTREQWAKLQPNTFQLFLTIIGMRLAVGHPTLADGVNLHRELRTGLLDHAQVHGYHSLLIVFDMTVETCLAQNSQRPEDRRLPEQQIRAQRQGLDSLLPQFIDEGWDQVVVLNEQRRIVQISLKGNEGYPH